MKNLIIASILTLSSLSAFATQPFYECTLPQAEEYRVGIDLNKNTAEFFDNDTTSTMNYTGYRKSKSHPEQNILIFKGQDASADGSLKLEFNISTKRIKLLSISSQGEIEVLGSAHCKVAQAWN